MTNRKRARWAIFRGYRQRFSTANALRAVGASANEDAAVSFNFNSEVREQDAEVARLVDDLTPSNEELNAAADKNPPPPEWYALDEECPF